MKKKFLRCGLGVSIFTKYPICYQDWANLANTTLVIREFYPLAPLSHTIVLPFLGCENITCGVGHSLVDSVTHSFMQRVTEYDFSKGPLMMGTSTFFPLIHKCLVSPLTLLDPRFIKGHIGGCGFNFFFFFLLSLSSSIPGFCTYPPCCSPGQQILLLKLGFLLVYYMHSYTPHLPFGLSPLGNSTAAFSLCVYIHTSFLFLLCLLWSSIFFQSPAYLGCLFPVSPELSTHS